MSHDYIGIHPEFNDAVLSERNLNNIAKWGYSDVKKDFRRIITDVRDFLVMNPILEKWSKNKQVYKIDKDFANILISTEKLNIYKNILLHLPYNAFYIDLSDAKVPDVEGEYVYVYNEGDLFCIVIYILTSDQVVFSHYVFLNLVNDEPFEVEKSEEKSNWDVLTEVDKFACHERNYLNNDRPSLSMLALQLLMYIGSNEPDIEESPVSKSTYSPECANKLTYKSIRTWDVGIRYGASLRLFRKKIEKEAKEKDENSEVKTITRNAPRPHMRCAHWQRYHVGKGRVETVLKWIPPVMVLGSTEMPLTIHCIK